MSLEQRAKEFATKAHASIDQRRKYVDEPYIVHPAAVAELVRGVYHTEEMLAAAWLHDVVEDTPVEIEEIIKEFGHTVADYVSWLTDVSVPSDGNRAARKLIDRYHSAGAPAEAQTIKVADLIDNTKTIVKYDLNFAHVYMREKELLLNVLMKADPHLMKVARENVENYKKNYGRR